jgi:demethylspheroidene O-methyltransferase
MRLGWELPFAEYLAATRDRLLSSPGFRRWATGFPLTRPIARRRARALFDLCAGFVYSQVLLACIRLGLFEMLSEGPQTVSELSRRLSLSEEATRQLLGAAVSLRLIARRRGDRFGLGELGAAMIGNAAVAAMVEHHTLLYKDLSDPVELLRGARKDTQLSQFWPYAGTERPANLNADRVAAYSDLMSASQPLIAEEVLDAYPLTRHRCLLDVGGGDGSFLASAAERAPNLQLMLFDLPAVAERARLRFSGAGLAGRAEAIGGDFLADRLPRGADVASLVRVIHDHNDERALTILCAVRRALPADGRVLLAEPMAGTPGAEPMGEAYFGFYLMAMGRGRARTFTELSDLLIKAGFGNVRLLPTRLPLQTRLLVASCASLEKE